RHAAAPLIEPHTAARGTLQVPERAAFETRNELDRLRADVCDERRVAGGGVVREPNVAPLLPTRWYAAPTGESDLMKVAGKRRRPRRAHLDVADELAKQLLSIGVTTGDDRRRAQCMLAIRQI